MSDKNPGVSIGLPVYNGERYLSRAIDSILAQDFSDLELIISDNASEDATQEICQEYLGRDPRIRYYRNEQNVGASKNWRRVSELSNGEYFKWHGHDDWISPRFLRSCLEVLDGDPNIVLCYCQEARLDRKGNLVESRDEPRGLDSPKPADRFHHQIWTSNRNDALYGLIRSSALRKTRLVTTTYRAQNLLLAELSLIGWFHHIPERLVFRTIPDYKSFRDRLIRLDPDKRGQIDFPRWRVCSEHLRAVRRSELPYVQQVALSIDVINCFAVHHPRALASDIKRAAIQFLARLRAQI